jgi:hypothetical protein
MLSASLMTVCRIPPLVPNNVTLLADDAMDVGSGFTVKGKVGDTWLFTVNGITSLRGLVPEPLWREGKAAGVTAAPSSLVRWKVLQRRSSRANAIRAALPALALVCRPSAVVSCKRDSIFESIFLIASL